MRASVDVYLWHSAKHIGDPTKTRERRTRRVDSDVARPGGDGAAETAWRRHYWSRCWTASHQAAPLLGTTSLPRRSNCRSALMRDARHRACRAWSSAASLSPAAVNACARSTSRLVHARANMSDMRGNTSGSFRSLPTRRVSQVRSRANGRGVSRRGTGTAARRRWVRAGQPGANLGANQSGRCRWSDAFAIDPPGLPR